MREIKYRQKLKPAYAKFCGEFHYWGFIDGAFHSPTGKNEACGESEQYAGLKDKNGAEIYEGDILKACGDSFYAVVEFDDRELMFSAKLYQNGYKIVSMGLTRFMRSRERAVNGKIKIIGNIHKHPELLETNND